MEKSNKTIVLEAYKYIIGQCNTELIDTYISDNYKQHSPTVKDGRAGLTEMIGFLKMIPRTGETASPIVRAIEDGDLVAVHLDIAFMGKRMAVIDIFRVEDGKLAEHWDAAQEYPIGMNSVITITNGPAIIEQGADTSKNKLLVKRFFAEAFEKRNLALATEHLSAGYTEHALEILLSAGKETVFLNARMEAGQTKTHRILGEGDFTVVQSEGIIENIPFVFYDIFRIENNKIAEHWSVQQQVPTAMAHSNGMI